jgi:MFS family permease
MHAPETILTPPVASRRRSWDLLAAIAAVTMFGLSIGQAVPLLSLLLESRGTDAMLNGLNAASAFLGVLVGPLLAPLGVRRVGLRRFLLACFALDIVTFLLLHVFDNIAAWFVLRGVLGLIGSSVFTASEAWINLLAGDAGRGRIVGLYAAALSAGFGIGPLLLAVTGTQGWPPFIANAIITAVAALPLFGASASTHLLGREHGTHPFRMFARAPLIVMAVVLFAVYEAALMALLPIWGVRIGFSMTLAAATLSAVYFGSVAWQWPIGLLSDKTARLTVLRGCAGGALLGAIVLATTSLPAPALLALLALWGGVAGAIYPIALSMAGDRFRGADLLSVNAAIIMAYGLGALVGPGVAGAAMDFCNPKGLLFFFILLFAGFLPATFIRWGGARKAAEQA